MPGKGQKQEKSYFENTTKAATSFSFHNPTLKLFERMKSHVFPYLCMTKSVSCIHFFISNANYAQIIPYSHKDTTAINEKAWIRVEMQIAKGHLYCCNDMQYDLIKKCAKVNTHRLKYRGNVPFISSETQIAIPHFFKCFLMHHLE